MGEAAWWGSRILVKDRTLQAGERDHGVGWLRDWSRAQWAVHGGRAIRVGGEEDAADHICFLFFSSLGKSGILKQPFPGCFVVCERRCGRGEERKPLGPVRRWTRTLRRLGRARAQLEETPAGTGHEETLRHLSWASTRSPFHFIFRGRVSLERLPLRAYCARQAHHAQGALWSPTWAARTIPCSSPPPPSDPFSRGCCRRCAPSCLPSESCFRNSPGGASLVGETGFPRLCPPPVLDRKPPQPLPRGAGRRRFVCQQKGGEYL